MLLCRIREVFVIDVEKLNYLNHMKPQLGPAQAAQHGQCYEQC